VAACACAADARGRIVQVTESGSTYLLGKPDPAEAVAGVFGYLLRFGGYLGYMLYALLTLFSQAIRRPLLLLCIFFAWFFFYSSYLSFFFVGFLLVLLFPIFRLVCLSYFVGWIAPSRGFILNFRI
jgi:hypothetical protein